MRHLDQPPRPPGACTGNPTARETITVVIPTFNVDPIIAACLDRLAWADEVIVVDMFSTDQTTDICRRYPNVRVVERKDYIFSNVNYGMSLATTDWVVRLDSDEVIGEQLEASIRRVLERPEPSIMTYLFPSVQHMFGRPMRYGVGLLKLNARKCMFRRGTARYECRSEHEDIISQGPTKLLEGHYDHLTNATASAFIRKADYYSDRDAERIRPEDLKRPQPLRILYRAARMFVLYYIQWQGYKDGYLGFFSSLFRGPLYLFMDEAKRWEAWMRRGGTSADPGEKTISATDHTQSRLLDPARE